MPIYEGREITKEELEEIVAKRLYEQCNVDDGQELWSMINELPRNKQIDILLSLLWRHFELINYGRATAGIAPEGKGEKYVGMLEIRHSLLQAVAFILTGESWSGEMYT